MDSIQILHLSDLHIGRNFIYDSGKELTFKIIPQIDQFSPQVVLVTGDIFDRTATEKDVQKAIEFFETFFEQLNGKNSNISKDDFLFVPGNHDLVKTTKGDSLERYKEFLKKFYGHLPPHYDETHLSCFRIFKESKIAVVAFNSSKIEPVILRKEKLKWIKSSIDSAGWILGKDKARKKLEKDYQSQFGKKYYNYGFIELEQMFSIFAKLEQKIGTVEDYVVIAAFHHHIFPFPETFQKDTGDISLIRNHDDVLGMLRKYNTRLVLHGHKHIPQVRPIIDDDSYVQPDKAIYVIANGSPSLNNLQHLHFQMVEVFSADEPWRIAEISKFEAPRHGAFSKKEIISIPPEEITDGGKPPKQLHKIVKRWENSLYKKYEKEIYNKYKGFYDTINERLIYCLSNIFTSYEEIDQRFKEKAEQALWVILFAYYYVFSCQQKKQSSPDLELNNWLVKIKTFFINDCLFESDNNPEFFEKLFSFLGHEGYIIREGQCKEYEELKELSLSPYHASAFELAVITKYLSELFLALGCYADLYYKIIAHKLNIKNPNKFHEHVSVRFLDFSAVCERRAIRISLTSTDPTCHKVAATIIKEFELHMQNFSKEFDKIGLKIYYLLPNISHEKNDYDLEDRNFEAYIPTLLPLLIGRNLYSQKEVFIRELIQNAIDATLLRQELDSDYTAELIQLVFGWQSEENIKKTRRKKATYFVSVIDSGIGMSQIQMERYLIHIGRSFYSSEEYKELKSKQNVSYKAISRFGIGFLSCFMSCQEISVRTKAYNEDNVGLHINIPNHEGCFFINQDKKKTFSIGTSITLYEDDKHINKQLDDGNILEYINENILNIPIGIKISGERKDKTSIDISISANKLKDQLKGESSFFQPFFFVPLDENGILSDNLEVNFGVMIIFPFPMSDNTFIEMNCGIKLGEGYTKERKKEKIFNPVNCKIYINYPPSFVELDVSREKITNFNKSIIVDDRNGKFTNEVVFKEIILEQMKKLAIEWLKDSIDIPAYIPLKVCQFFVMNDNNIKPLQKELYSFKITLQEKNLLFTFEKIGEKCSEIQRNKPLRLSDSIIYLDRPNQIFRICPILFFFFIKMFLNLKFVKETSSSSQVTVPKDDDNSKSNNFLENIIINGLGRDLEERFGRHLEERFGRHLEERFGRHFEEIFGRDFEEIFGRDLEEIFGRHFEERFGRDLEEIFGRHLEERFGRDLEEIFGRHFEERFGRDLEEIFGRHFEERFGRDLEEIFGRHFEEIFGRHFEEIFGRHFEERFGRHLEERFGRHLKRWFKVVFRIASRVLVHCAASIVLCFYVLKPRDLVSTPQKIAMSSIISLFTSRFGTQKKE